MERGAALSLSNFDVGGTTNPKGTKGFLFGERGVWRPGDDIFLTFIVTSDNPLPENHPASVEFFNPNGQLVQTLVSNGSSDGIYTFKLGTTPAAPTGQWLARVSLGGAVFEKAIRVDAIKPNRMKIDMRLGDGKRIDARKFTGSLTAKWLHGAPADGAKVTLQARTSGRFQRVSRVMRSTRSTTRRNISKPRSGRSSPAPRTSRERCS
ncbi:MAG: MG2 domain-containing protein [Alistipes finegoldii]